MKILFPPTRIRITRNSYASRIPLAIVIGTIVDTKIDDIIQVPFDSISCNQLLGYNQHDPNDEHNPNNRHSDKE